MPQTADPFAHHPEMRDKIIDPLQSFFRTFRIVNMAEMMDNQGLETNWWHSDADREASRTSALKQLGDNDLWVFAYGSLMWDPAFVFTDVRKGHAPDFARRFILREDRGGRGNPEAPGLFAALDRGQGCDGLAFKIARHQVDNETEVLWRREMVGPGYEPVFIDLTMDQTPVQALAFVADHSTDRINASLTFDQQVEMIATASGVLGSNLQYLDNIVAQFEILDIKDQYIADLKHHVDAYRQTRSISSDR